MIWNIIYKVIELVYMKFYKSMTQWLSPLIKWLILHSGNLCVLFFYSYMCVCLCVCMYTHMCTHTQVILAIPIPCSFPLIPPSSPVHFFLTKIQLISPPPSAAYLLQRMLRDPCGLQWHGRQRPTVWFR